ncbi:MAG: septum site-determining protein MinD [Ruminococcaceae bacterium]|nr:septum site-determining protein MinD [Oscillospiraceae bacterium]
MGEVISFISGKGGTGKTTLCAAIATCLAAEGKKVLCIDTDIGLRNLDISLGMADQPIIAFTDVLHGHYHLSDATEHPDLNDLFLLTAPVRTEEADIDPVAFGELLQEIRKEYDFCLIDSPAGIGSGFHLSTGYADRFVIVSTPDPASMRDAAHTAELLTLEKKDEVHLIVNRINPKLFPKMELTVDDIMDEVGLPLLGIVPDDQNVVLAASAGDALIFNESKGAAEACLRISRRLRGVPTRLMKL